MNASRALALRTTPAFFLGTLAIVAACSSSAGTSADAGSDSGFGDATTPVDAKKGGDAAKGGDASHPKDATSGKDVVTGIDAPGVPDVMTVPDGATSHDAGVDATSPDATTHDAGPGDASSVDAHDAASTDAHDAAPSLLANGQACTATGQCTSGHCADGVCCDGDCTGTCQACVSAQTGVADGTCAPQTAGTDAPAGECVVGSTCGNTGKCGFGGACEVAIVGTICGTTSCSNGALTTAGTCNGTGTCAAGLTTSCPGGFICASATACKTACASDGDCESTADDCFNPGAAGTCVGKGGAGATCASNDQCTSSECGTTGIGHCCTAVCSATVAACGATDCNTSGACAYPGNTVAPAALQTPGDCQKIVCNGSGADTSVDDPTDLPVSSSPCLINPSCCGPSPLAPCFTDAPTGTPCTTPGDTRDSVCGNASNGNIAGTCVECNTDVDCLKVNPAGTLACDMSTGTCE